jgi:hypothetical protein
MGRVGNHVAVRVEQGIRHTKRVAEPEPQVIIPDMNVSAGGK